MFIRAVDEGLERLLRAQLPLSAEAGDISFDAPTSTWSAQLSRITVNLFLYDVSRSDQPSRSMTHRVGPDGQAQRRAPQPLVRLNYLVSAWAGSPRDEHQLLGDVIDRVAGLAFLSPDYLAVPVSASVQLGFGEDPHNRPRDIWSAAGAQLKAGFVLSVTTASDTFDWDAEAPAVERIEVQSKRDVVAF